MQKKIADVLSKFSDLPPKSEGLTRNYHLKKDLKVMWQSFLLSFLFSLQRVPANKKPPCIRNRSRFSYKTMDKTKGCCSKTIGCTWKSGFLFARTRCSSMEAPSKAFLLFFLAPCLPKDESAQKSNGRWFFRHFFTQYLFHRSRNNRRDKLRSKLSREKMFGQPHLKLPRWCSVRGTNNFPLSSLEALKMRTRNSRSFRSQ